ncbi:VOC family protein [Sphaerotilus microaerophilus]|uniref:Glyoxalase n=1 Tax=Sphaerotilus microaerophilus TaxID=2914710 RepID=A0ABM7YPY9_9BURK|nr:VOC family protein [Sphaerotilus sp. FB-5]BDI06562.1 glyoxalase [Sphaerotilus sp. FB-5]
MADAVFTLLHVSDPAASARFYEALLERAPIEASPSFAMFALGPGAMLGLWQREGVAPASAGSPGCSELALAVADRATVDAHYAHYGRWVALGCTLLQAPTAMDFGYTCVVQDPDGHRIRVFTPEGT